MRGSRGYKPTGGALAAAAEVAELSSSQREILLLAAQGLPVRQIAARLALPWRQVGPQLVAGCEKLAFAHQRLIGRRLREIRQILHCQRNRQPASDTAVGNPHAPVALYARIPGGHDDTPVTVRARPHGERAEDHLEDPFDFLAAFELLANGSNTAGDP